MPQTSRIGMEISGLKPKQETQHLGLPALQGNFLTQAHRIHCIIIMVLAGWRLPVVRLMLIILCRQVDLWGAPVV
jgi:hypothetical protein